MAVNKATARNDRRVGPNRPGGNPPKLKRNKRILDLYVEEGLTQEEIGKIFGLHQTRVGAIIYRFADTLKLDAKRQKAKRLNKLQRMLRGSSDELAKGKDATSIIAEIRKEYEGEGQSIQPINNIKVVIQKAETENGNTPELTRESTNRLGEFSEV